MSEREPHHEILETEAQIQDKIEQILRESKTPEEAERRINDAFRRQAFWASPPTIWWEESTGPASALLRLLHELSDDQRRGLQDEMQQLVRARETHDTDDLGESEMKFLVHALRNLTPEQRQRLEAESAKKNDKILIKLLEHAPVPEGMTKPQLIDLEIHTSHRRALVLVGTMAGEIWIIDAYCEIDSKKGSS